MTVQVGEKLVGPIADKDNEYPYGAHLSRLEAAFEPLYMGALQTTRRRGVAVVRFQ